MISEVSPTLSARLVLYFATSSFFLPSFIGSRDQPWEEPENGASVPSIVFDHQQSSNVYDLWLTHIAAGIENLLYVNNFSVRVVKSSSLYPHQMIHHQ